MLARAVTTLGGVVSAAALLAATASIWLVLANPVGVADAVSDRGGRAFVEAVATAIVKVLRCAVRWL